MGIISYLVSLAVVGLVIGAVARLIVPGPNPIGIGATILIGIAGAFLGAVIGGLLGLGFVSIVFEVAIATALVYLTRGRLTRGRLTRGRPSRSQLPPTGW